MNFHFSTKFPIPVMALCGLGLAAGIVSFRARADQWDKKTVLSVNEPIQVRERLLEPGRYVFRLADSNSDRHIVQIYNADQTHIIDTILAIPNERLHPSDKSQFMFWETPPGTVRAMRAWFSPGDVIGQEFPYPRQLARLEMPAPLPAPQPEPSTAAPPQQETPAPPPPPQQPEPQSLKREPTQQPVEMAQNATPPAPQPKEPENLPKSASPYPAIGLGGLLSLSVYAVLRLKRLV